jgi:uncharacterized protein (DUF1778 family)
VLGAESKKLKKIEARVTEDEFDLILQAAIRTRSASLSEFLRRVVVRQSRTLSDTKHSANRKSPLVA